MRLAIISDIHGNALALQTVLDDLAQRPCDPNAEAMAAQYR